MNSQDKLGLTVCYRTDDEDDIGIYISEVGRLISYNYHVKTKRSWVFFLLALTNPYVWLMEKSLGGHKFVSYITLHGVTSLHGD